MDFNANADNHTEKVESAPRDAADKREKKSADKREKKEIKAKKRELFRQKLSDRFSFVKKFTSLAAVQKIAAFFKKVDAFAAKVEIPPFIYVPVSVLFMELLLRGICFSEFFTVGLLYLAMFDLVFALIILIIGSAFKSEKTNRTVIGIILLLIGFYFAAQIMYHHIYTVFFVVASTGGAGQVLEFWRIILRALRQTALPLILVFLPGVLVLLCRRNFSVRKSSWPVKVAFLLLAVVLQVSCTMLINTNKKDAVSVNYVYNYMFDPELSARNFGLLTMLRLDVKYQIFDIRTPPATDSSVLYGDSTPTEVGMEYNIISGIDFDELIANETDSVILDMHEYYSNIEPTEKNGYTGIFENKNFILIVAESFSPYLYLNYPEYFPALAQMYSESIRFTNFYNPFWYVNTYDGEYVIHNSQIPTSGDWSLLTAAYNYLPFAFGNQFRTLGYNTTAYHDHYATFYSRYISHPSLGYTYIARGQGLDITGGWPENDLEMMEQTVDDYITPYVESGQLFHTYYLTVSGHHNYIFNNNTQAYNNRDIVADLDASEAVRAYIACNYSFELAIEYLLASLEDAGILDDTVIAISADHYPYGLETWEYEELAGHELEDNFEIYKEAFFIWNSETGSMDVDTLASTFDILPTLSNMFGLEYDSRFLVGHDIFSGADPLVLFKTHSFMTEAGSYNATTGEFIANEGYEDTTNEYIAEMAQTVNDRFTYSARLLNTDYYSYVLSDWTPYQNNDDTAYDGE